MISVCAITYLFKHTKVHAPQEAHARWENSGSNSYTTKLCVGLLPRLILHLVDHIIFFTLIFC